jgi:hypothetical protein
MSKTNNKAIITRLLLQRILASDAVQKYTARHQIEEMSSAFLTVSEPDLLVKTERLNFGFSLQSKQASSSYYGKVAELDTSWTVIKDSLQDADGNLWRSEKMVINLHVASAYSVAPARFADRAECMTNISQLLSSMLELVSDPIATMTHNNEERIKKEADEAYTATCKNIENVILNNKCSRKNMRVGTTKILSSQLFDGLQLAPNDYKLVFNDGTKNRPRYKYYMLVVKPQQFYYKFVRKV